MSSFSSLGLSEPFLRAVEDLKFESPSEIQALAIPPLLEDPGDFIALSQTGTGKTAAFGLPLLQNFKPELQLTQGLILAPTRELAQQIAEQMEHFAKYIPSYRQVTVFGGAPITPQIKLAKKNPQLIIATPGRLVDLIERGAVSLQELQFLVLDEADEMLNMGFQDELERILKETPDKKHTWLFSATMPGAIRGMVKRYMKDPRELRVTKKDEVNKNIAHHYTLVSGRNKAPALGRFIDSDPQMRAVVFCRTKRDTQDLAEWLLQRSYRADALHGDMSQPQRDRVMRRFKANELQVLIATDVAARGIDVNDLTHVFHHSLPDDAAYYTHRSGRTARAGRQGLSIVLIGDKERYKVNRFAKQLGIEFSSLAIPSAEEVKHQLLAKVREDVVKMPPPLGITREMWEATKAELENLSREEIIARFLQRELNQLTLASEHDLNEKPGSRSGGGPSKYKGGKSGFKKGSYKGGSNYKGKKASGYSGGKRPRKGK